MNRFDENGVLHEEREITVSLAEYKNLIIASERLKAILQSIYRDVRLGYDGKSLRFDDSIIDAILRVVDRMNYDLVLETLQRKEAADGSNV